MKQSRENDEIARLILAILQRDCDVVRALVEMMGVMSYMADKLPGVERMRFAEGLRDLADHVEHEQPALMEHG